MGNESVVYIDYLESYLDVASDRLPKWFRRLLYLFYNFWGIIKVNGNSLTLMCVENGFMNKRMLKNIKKRLSKIELNTVVCADLFLKSYGFADFLKELDYEILEGKWIYKFLPYDIIKKISYVKNVDISNLEVSILANQDTDVVIENIKLIAKECKILNIITDNMNGFYAVEKFFLDEYGIIINVTSNREKSLLHSDLIFNFDFSIAELKVCNIKQDSILVQMNGEKFERREGITICSCMLNLPYKYLEFFKDKEHFDDTILYESLLYYKTSFGGIRRILSEDNIGIRYFIGNNGKIKFQDLVQKRLDKFE